MFLEKVTTKIMDPEKTTALKVSREDTVGIITTMEEDSRSVEMVGVVVPLEVEVEEVNNLLISAWISEILALPCCFDIIGFQDKCLVSSAGRLYVR